MYKAKKEIKTIKKVLFHLRLGLSRSSELNSFYVHPQACLALRQMPELQYCYLGPVIYKRKTMYYRYFEMSSALYLETHKIRGSTNSDHPEQVPHIFCGALGP